MVNLPRNSVDWKLNQYACDPQANGFTFNNCKNFIELDLSSQWAASAEEDSPWGEPDHLLVLLADGLLGDRVPELRTDSIKNNVVKIYCDPDKNAGNWLYWDCDCSIRFRRTVLRVNSLIIMIDQDAKSLTKKLDHFRLGGVG